VCHLPSFGSGSVLFLSTVHFTLQTNYKIKVTQNKYTNHNNQIKQVKQMKRFLVFNLFCLYSTYGPGVLGMMAGGVGLPNKRVQGFKILYHSRCI